jgi:hypothetical protein
MRGAIPPLPNTLYGRGAELKKYRDIFTFTTSTHKRDTISSSSSSSSSNNNKNTYNLAIYFEVITL